MRKNRRQAVCETCGKTFEHKASKPGRFCSKVCWSRRNPPAEHTCETCGAAFRTYHTEQRFCSRSCARKGTRSNAYKDGRSLERDRARLAPELKAWRLAVFKRDKFKCRTCGSTEALHAHHVKEWATHPDLRFVVSNGLTLCASCHGKVHGKDFSNRLRKYCPECNAPTTGRGKGGLCRSCSIRLWHRGRVSVQPPARPSGER